MLFLSYGLFWSRDRSRCICCICKICIFCRCKENFRLHRFSSADKENIEDLESKKLVEGKLSQVLPEKQKEIEKEAGGIKKIQAVEAVFNKDMTQAEIKVEVVFNGRLKGKTSTIEPVRLVKTKQGWKVQIK